jgi:hypothetical protein
MDASHESLLRYAEQHASPEFYQEARAMVEALPRLSRELVAQRKELRRLQRLLLRRVEARRRAGRRSRRSGVADR